MNQTSTVDPSGDVSFQHYADPAGGKPDYDLVKNGSQNLIASYAYDSFGRTTQKVMPKVSGPPYFGPLPVLVVWVLRH